MLRCVSLNAAEGWVLFFIHPVSLFLFIGELKPLMLRDIKEQCLLIPASAFVVVVVRCVPLF